MFLLSLIMHSGDDQKESNMVWPSAGLVTARHGGVFRGWWWQGLRGDSFRGLTVRYKVMRLIPNPE